MLQESYPFYLANAPQTPNTDLEVTNKYTGEIATRVALANAADIDKGIAAAEEATEPMGKLPPYERQAILNHCRRSIYGTIRRTRLLTLCGGG